MPEPSAPPPTPPAGRAPGAGPDPSAPWGRRFAAYLEERFPPGAMLVFSLVTVGSAAAACAAAARAPVRLDLGLALLALAHVTFLLLLRVLDEHKDFARDREAYPERVLSRGLVTLPQLARVGWVAGLVGLACSAALGAFPLGAFVAVLVFGLLMAKEFFLGELLRKDVFFYAATHQPINPLITAWLVTGVLARGWGTPHEDALALPVLWSYVLAQLLLGFGFEVARKVWTPAEERPDLVDSYSAHAIGPRGAGALALAFLLGGLALVAWFVEDVGLPRWVHAPLGVCALLVVSTVGRFAWAPFPGASKKLAGAVGLGSLVLHGGLVAGALAQHGSRAAAWLGAS